MRNSLLNVAATATLISALWAPAHNAHAATWTSGRIMTLTCTQFVATGSSTVTFNRDTTGAGSERLRFEGPDGDGNVLWSETTMPYPPNSTILLGAGTWNYQNPATRNPLSYRIVSPAGNGLPEQVLYSAVGSCASLPDSVATVPTLEFWGLSLMALAAAGLGAGQLRRRRSRE